MQFRLRRGALITLDKADHAAPDRSLAYWRQRSASERLAAVEFLRRQYDGSGARLRRVLRVTERAAGRPKDLADIAALGEAD